MPSSSPIDPTPKRRPWRRFPAGSCRDHAPKETSGRHLRRAGRPDRERQARLLGFHDQPRYPTSRVRIPAHFRSSKNRRTGRVHLRPRRPRCRASIRLQPEESLQLALPPGTHAPQQRRAEPARRLHAPAHQTQRGDPLDRNGPAQSGTTGIENRCRQLSHRVQRLQKFCKEHRNLLVTRRSSPNRIRFLEEFVFAPKHAELLRTRESKREAEAFERGEYLEDTRGSQRSA